MNTEKRRQEILRLVELGYRDSVFEERGGREDYHRAVDRPAHEHRQKRIEEFVFQLLLDDGLVLKVPLASLYDFRMKEKIVRHHDGAEHAHDDDHRALGKRGRHPTLNRVVPVDVHEGKLVKKRKPDQRNERDNTLLDRPVRVRKKHDDDENRDENRAGTNRYAKQHVERDAAAENFRERRRDRRDHHRRQDDLRPGRFHVHGRRLGQAQARRDAEMRHVVLKHDEHDRRERHHPQKNIAVGSSGGKIGRPVSRIDESDGDQ